MATTLSQNLRAKEEILKRYPIRNDLWSYVGKTGVVVVEMSQFRKGTMTDPWDRPISNDFSTWHKDWGDCEDEACISWEKTTTVAGVPFELVIIND